MESAREYKTPLKRRVRDFLEEDDLEDYDAMEIKENLNWNNVKHYLSQIDKALKVNQAEHQKFRSGQIELEDNFREILYATNNGFLNRKIGKRPKIMDEKIDGPDLYSVVGSVAEELIDLTNEVENKLDKTALNTKLKSQH